LIINDIEMSMDTDINTSDIDKITDFKLDVTTDVINAMTFKNDVSGQIDVLIMSGSDFIKGKKI